MDRLTENRDLADSLLASELATRQEVFARAISQLVAKLGASGNRFSTALVAKMEEAGREELQNRAVVIVEVWCRVLARPHSSASGELADATSHALDRLGKERSRVERTVLDVQMGSIPHHPDFLLSTEELLRTSVPTQLRLAGSPTSAGVQPGAGQDEVVEVKPNFFGMGINVRALWRRMAGRRRR